MATLGLMVGFIPGFLLLNLGTTVFSMAFGTLLVLTSLILVIYIPVSDKVQALVFWEQYAIDSAKRLWEIHTIDEQANCNNRIHNTWDNWYEGQLLLDEQNWYLKMNDKCENTACYSCYPLQKCPRCNKSFDAQEMDIRGACVWCMHASDKQEAWAKQQQEEQDWRDHVAEQEDMQDTLDAQDEEEKDAYHEDITPLLPKRSINEYDNHHELVAWQTFIHGRSSRVSNSKSKNTWRLKGGKGSRASLRYMTE